MTDEVENLAKAMWRECSNCPSSMDWGRDGTDAGREIWRGYARAALSHLGERRGISFEGMNSMHLETLEHCLQPTHPVEAKLCRDELARRAAKPAERDEWREAINGAFLNDRGFWDSDEAAANRILAAIAPLREREYEVQRAARIDAEQRAEATEAKLAAIREAVNASQT